MDNENHKNTWNNFTKFVLWGTVAVVIVLVLMVYKEDKKYTILADFCYNLKNFSCGLEIFKAHIYIIMH